MTSTTFVHRESSALAACTLLVADARYQYFTHVEDCGREGEAGGTYSLSTRPMQILHVVILVPLTQPWRRSLSRGGFLDVLVLGGEDVFSVGDGGEESMIL